MVDGPSSGLIQKTAPSAICRPLLSVQSSHSIPMELIAPGDEASVMPILNQESNSDSAETP
jgi:hypothetical protein